MTNEELEALVRRLEGSAKAHPASYRLRVCALALLGYAYVLAVAGLALGLVALIGASFFAGKGPRPGMVHLFKPMLALLALVGAVARALWVKLEAPQGIPLARAEFPELFERIERVRSAVRAPRAHAVLLTDDFNAAVVQQPRLGVFGWQKNYLLLGLPLLRALSVEQLEAVLAHEFGHLSGAHGRLGAWIYRARLTWARIHQKMESESHWASFVFLPFMRWYAPYFHAYSFVQARAQEYEADRVGARASSPSAMADALLALRVRAAQLGEYWDRVRASADVQPEPGHPFAQMRFDAPDATSAGQAIEQALRAETTLDDTHPCLRERLAALGQAARTPPPPAGDAAQQLFGARLEELAVRIDQSWRSHVRESWSERHRVAQESRARLAELARKPSPLSLEETWERATLAEQLEGAEAGRARYAEVLALDPNHAGAFFAIGRTLLAAGDASGLDSLERALAATDHALLPATRLALDFLRRVGREEDAKRWIARAEPYQQKLIEARRERAQLAFDGRYEASGLDAESLTRLRDRLHANPRVKHAWLVRRQVQHFQESPLFVLGVKRRWEAGDFVWRAGRRARDLSLQNQLTKYPIPGEYFILVVNHRGRKERALFTDVAGSLVYER